MRMNAVIARTFGFDCATPNEENARRTASAFRMGRLYHGPFYSWVFVSIRGPIFCPLLQSPFTLKNPLLGLLAAIAAGILAFRFIPFGQFEILAGIGAFFLL